MGLRRDKVVELLLPWAGIAGASLAWAVSHQIGSDSIFDDCRVGSPLFIGLLGLVALVLAGGSGFLSYRLWRRGDKESEGRRFVALIGLLLALLLGFAILLQTAASFILPRCVA